MSGAQRMSFWFPIVMVLSFVWLAAPAGADFQAGMDAYKHGDYATALREWRPLAERGDAAAQYNLGLLYDNGQKVRQDYVQARQWYEKSAAQENVDAQFMLGEIYRSGRGVPQDYVTARHWYEKAALQGDPQAQNKLGISFELGVGGLRDYVQALMWYTLAATAGDKKGTEFRDRLTKRMNPAEIAEAKKLTREWKPKGK
jgi:TPR repeat protein